jgi:DNA-binding transcriptional LysR family regulator
MVASAICSDISSGIFVFTWATSPSERSATERVALGPWTCKAVKSALQIKHLQYLVVLARERHYGRAAAVLAISQPALTQAVQQLEKHFGVPIVQRAQTGFQGFTQDGENILAWARQATADHDRLVTLTGAEHKGGMRGTLRLALAPVTMSIVSLLTTPFADRYPNVTISITSRTLRDLERDFRNFDVDVGVSYLDAVEQPGLRPYLLYDESYYLLVPDGHELSDRRTIDWREVGELPLCMLAPTLQNRVVLNRIFERVGVAPQVVIETDCSLGLFAHMRSNKWLTVVPHSYFYLLGDWGFIRSIPIVNPVVTSAIGLLIQERNPIPPVVQAFLDVAEEASVGQHLDRYRPRSER